MKMIKRSVLNMLLLILVLGTILAGCAGEPEPKETSGESKANSPDKDKIVLDFWTFWGSEIRRPIVEEIINDFNESQNEIEVKHTYLPWGDIWTKSLASIAAGNPPDIIINDINTVAQRAEKKQNTNLAEFVEKEVGFADQFFENTWTPMLYEGDPYAIPFDTDTYMLFYNKKIFKEVGLDPEKPPTTWSELEKYAEKIDKKKGEKYERIGFLPRHGAGADVYMLNTDGQSYWDYDENEPVINSESNIEALQWIKDYEERYGQKVINSFSAEFGSETADPFIAGKIGMYISPSTFYTQIRDYGEDMDIGVAPLPKREGYPGEHTTWGGGFVAEIPYGAKHPEASWEFLKYLASQDAQEYWAVQNFTNVPNIKASEAAAKNEELSELGQTVYQASVDNLNNTVRTPAPLEAPDYLSVINPEIEKALLGEQSAEEALNKAQKAVEKLIEQSK
ncbi:ABC transporter substrate-binding protein [Lederbergia ruris]|uniref:ABC transporter substrate-binding protein n=1 Tax=Lederbergia ruris TaxID=217495 RepID=UPI0039A199AD